MRDGCSGGLHYEGRRLSRRYRACARLEIGREEREIEMAGKMLIRIPETPGIPAVLREIATLCPRHSSTAEQHGYSLSSPPA